MMTDCDTAEYLRIPRSPVRQLPPERVSTEYLEIDSHTTRSHHHSPRSSHDAFIVEASPSRRADFDYEEIVERPRPRPRAISRPRSISVHGRRRAVSSVQLVEPRSHFEEHIESRPHSGQLMMVRPRDSDHEVDAYIRELEEETRLLRLERQGGIEITRQRETDTVDNRGNAEEKIEINRSERKGIYSSNYLLQYRYGSHLLIIQYRTQFSGNARDVRDFDMI